MYQMHTLTIPYYICNCFKFRSHTALIAGAAAQKYGRPVRLALTCAEDMTFSAAHHEVVVSYEVTCTKSGKISTAKFKAFANAGCSTDLSVLWVQVSSSTQLHTCICMYNIHH